MALPASGSINMDDIRVELGVSTQTPFGLNEARSGNYAAINPNSTYKPPSSGTVSLSDWYGYNHTQAGTATLSWTYSETGGANGEMRLHVNSSVVVTTTSTSNGTYTIYQGDDIYVEIELLSACSGNDNKGNVYTQSSKIALVNGDCFISDTGLLTTGTYTVVAGDLGTTISLDCYAQCDGACL